MSEKSIPISRPTVFSIYTTSLLCSLLQSLLLSTVQAREETIEKQYVSAVEKQAHKCEELLTAQVSKMSVHGNSYNIP